MCGKILFSSVMAAVETHMSSWRVTYYTVVGNQASDILLKKLLVPFWKNKFSQSTEKVAVLL